MKSKFFELESRSSSIYINFYVFIFRTCENLNLSTRLHRILFELYRNMSNNTYELYNKASDFSISNSDTKY